MDHGEEGATQQGEKGEQGQRMRVEKLSEGNTAQERCQKVPSQHRGERRTMTRMPL